VELVDGERCARFTTVVLSGIEVQPSPEWVVRRLAAAGMRPINNVVDASNYVMLELNQPNHAYDLDALGGGGFRVRLARDGEMITTLDGVSRRMTADDLLICDANDVPIGVGGVMGGLDSEITDATTVVALEIAYFEPTAITRTMNRTASGRRHPAGSSAGSTRTAFRSHRRASASSWPRPALDSSCTTAPSTRATTRCRRRFGPQASG
jgi:phenylalanyl-tRNA synthetase beta chain